MNTLLLSLVLGAPALVQPDEFLPTELMLAASIIDSPTNTPLPAFGDDWKRMRGAIFEIALEREIIDQRECRYFMTELETFEADVNLLRTRNLELANAPKLSEVNRMIGRDFASDAISFNREFKQYLENRLIWESDKGDIIREAIKQCDKYYRIYDALRDARCEFYYVTVRRQALDKYRSMIGNEDFMSGKPPKYVPEWAFK